MVFSSSSSFFPLSHLRNNSKIKSINYQKSEGKKNKKRLQFMWATCTPFSRKPSPFFGRRHLIWHKEPMHILYMYYVVVFNALHKTKIKL